MKYETFSEYDPRHTGLAESAFLTVWAGLGQWREDLVLVGGLVPKYLCGDLTAQRELPRPATLDVDLGIALAADADQYGNLHWDLLSQGFSPDEKTPSRYEKVIADFTVPIDFLVESPRATSGTIQVLDITAGIMPGVNRALASARTMDVAGIDLHGAEQKLTARICEVGPFLALKLRAFGSRQQPKDAFDILYTILHYDGGTDAAISAFAEEVRLGNPACRDALRTLFSKWLCNEGTDAFPLARRKVPSPDSLELVGTTGSVVRERRQGIVATRTAESTLHVSRKPRTREPHVPTGAGAPSRSSRQTLVGTTGSVVRARRQRGTAIRTSESTLRMSRNPRTRGAGGDALLTIAEC
ncbi:MAG: hypothetical protein WEB60_09375 [Terrimicrobiaceae bacterium]